MHQAIFIELWGQFLYFYFAEQSDDFGEASFIRGRTEDKLSLVYRSTDRPESFKIFRKAARTKLVHGGETYTFRCTGCEKVSAKGIVGTTKVRNGRILTDPTIGHNRECVDVSAIDVEALRISREMRDNCRKGERPMQAHSEALINVSALFPNDQTIAEAIQDKIGPYHKNRQSLYKYRFFTVHSCSSANFMLISGILLKNSYQSKIRPSCPWNTKSRCRRG